MVFCAGHPSDDAHEAPEGWRTAFAWRRISPWPPSGKWGLDYFHGAPGAGRLTASAAFSRTRWNSTDWRRLGLNIVLHTRDRKGSGSFEDALAIARTTRRVRPVFHCFIGDTAQA
ncbi:MAG: hypothetical protein ACLT8E_10815 [Akkermansia sp.]